MKDALGIYNVAKILVSVCDFSSQSNKAGANIKYSYSIAVLVWP